jgi:hypothetical protein
MSQFSGVDTVVARDIARSELDAWIGAAATPEQARRRLAPDSELRTSTLSRVDAVLAHDRPRSANRRWLCEILRNWAPLEILFPTRDYRGLNGVSGELPLHASLLVEREYGHVLAISRGLPVAFDLLRADRDSLALQLAVAAALHKVFRAETITEAEDLEWLENLKAISLAMAEYLHRQSIGLAPVLSDGLVMHYTAQIARTQRLLREECLARCVVEGIEAQRLG